MNVAGFLARYPPFDALAEEELSAIAGAVQIEFFRAGTVILQQTGEPSRFLYVIRTGSVELLLDDRVVDLLLEGEAFGHPSLLSGQGPAFTVRTREDALCYLIEEQDAEAILSGHAGLVFLANSLRRRTSRAVQGVAFTAVDRWAAPVVTLVRRPPLMCDPTSTIREAAQLMAGERASSVLVETRNGFGIFTDRDLRSKVIAPGRTPNAPVAEVMSHPVQTVGGRATAGEALMLMLDRGIHHLPITGSDGRILGIVTDTDLMGLELQTPFIVKTAIERAGDASEVAAAARGLQTAVCDFVNANVDPVVIGNVVAMTIDTMTRRLIGLAIDRLGDPPVPWAWLALGSQARREQGLRTDQDHAIAFAPGDRPAGDVDPYFADMASSVTDGLELAGIPRCRGGVMAEREAWRLPVDEWVTRFRGWGEATGDTDVRFPSIALDYRRIEGPLDVEPALDEVIRSFGRRSIAVRRMGHAASTFKPPVGFLGRLVVERSGAHGGTLDIKHGGIIPITSLARTLAIAAAMTDNRTLVRLEAGRRLDALTDDVREGLSDAFRLLWQIRVEHQAGAITSGGEPDDLVDPDSLGTLTRQSLKDAFTTIAHGQRMLERWLELAIS